MLRLNLGDLIEWEGDEYIVAACTAMATLLYRLADGRRVWVDLAAVTAAGVAIHVIPQGLWSRNSPRGALRCQVYSLPVGVVESPRPGRLRGR